VRERCYECFRPKNACFCEAIPSIDNRTNVLILQHVCERYHAFNTARIVHKALQRCELLVDHNRNFAGRSLPIAPNAGLLYLHSDAKLLDDLAPHERPDQLVIIDGTWHQAKTIVRDTPQLSSLPCYRLSPTSPGQYRIRREPDAQSLSTVEATVAALRALEPETAGMAQLLRAFHQMVETQLGHPETHAVWRSRKDRDRRVRKIPRALEQDGVDLVVAYGEATPSMPGLSSPTTPRPINWIAQRIRTGERFASCIQPLQPLTDLQLKYMRLEVTDFDEALTPTEFRAKWDDFIQPKDVVAVYHDRTKQLLAGIQATPPRSLVLKAIFRPFHPTNRFRSLDELLQIEEIPPPSPRGKSRAEERLEMAIALVESVIS
jgi:DTW domain-containing protein YfiP